MNASSPRFVSLLAGIALAGSLCAGCELDADADLDTDADADLEEPDLPSDPSAQALAPLTCYRPPALPYQDIQQRSIHNAYTRAESIFDQLAFHRVRNMEWDIRSQPVTNIYGPTRDDNDWYVYHSVSESRRCDKLSDCLTLLKAYHDAVPQHEVITISLEFKGDDACVNDARTFPYRANVNDPTKQTAAGLDARLRATLGDALFTPLDLLSWCPGSSSLQDAVRSCGWPTTDELRGRIIFDVLAYNEKRCEDYLGGSIKPSLTERALTEDYAPDQTTAESRVAFSAPLNRWWTDDLLRGQNWVVVHTEVNRERAIAIRQNEELKNHILRSSQADDASTFASFQAAGFNLINTDQVSILDTPWADTANAAGYPFCPRGRVGSACTGASEIASRREIGSLFDLRAASGDLDHENDDFVLRALYRPLVGQPTVSYTAYVSSPSNRGIHGWAKGCLMARASSARNSAYYAICKAGDNHELSAQYRAPCAGCGTDHIEASLGHGFDGEDAAFVRLDVGSYADGRTWAQGYGSANGGLTWQPIGPRREFSVDLPLQGISTSGNDPSFRGPQGSIARFLFGNLTANGTPVAAASLSQYLSIGRVDQREFADLTGVAGCTGEGPYQQIGRAAVAGKDGKIDAFVLGTDQAVWHVKQTSPSGGWGTWSSLGGNVRSTPVVARNLDGRLEMLVVGFDNQVYHQWQDANGNWSGWANMGGQIAGLPAVGRNADGRLEIVARGTDNAVWHKEQVVPNGGWSGWASFGGAVQGDPAIGMNKDGRLEVFARGMDHAIWRLSQVGPNGVWTGWTSLGGSLRSNPAVGRNLDGRLEVFAVGWDDQLFHTAQNDQGLWSGSWTGRGVYVLGTPTIGRHADGRLEVIAVDTATSLGHLSQSAPNSSTWSGWSSYGGTTSTRTPDVTINQDGRLEVFTSGVNDRVLYHAWQLAPNAGWSGWAPFPGLAIVPQ